MPTKRDPKAPCINLRREPTIHELGIRMLVQSDARICRNGFARAVKGLVEELDAALDCVPSGFLPDAYAIDREAKEILLYEVEDTSVLTPEKLKTIAYFWLAWDGDDYDDWIVRLFTTDRYGRNSAEVDLCAAYCAFIPEEAARLATSEARTTRTDEVRYG